MRTFMADLEEARSGNVHAIERVLAKSRGDIHRYAVSHCTANDVEDVVQDSLYIVSKKLGDLRNPEVYASWLFCIVKRECYRYGRTRSSLMQVPISEDMAAPYYSEQTSLMRDVAKVLTLIPPHYREIILLRDMEGYSIQEIMIRLELSKEACKARLHRARAIMREHLSL